MVKEFLTDTLEMDKFLENDLSFKKEYIEKRDRAIVLDTVFAKPKILAKSLSTRRLPSEFSSLERIRIVVDSLIRNSSVASVCRKEGIEVSTYNAWKKDFLKAFKRYSEQALIEEKIKASNKDLILKGSSEQVYSFFTRHIKKLGSSKTLVIPKGERLSVYSNFYKIQNVFILNRMNDFRRINKHLEEVNEKLPIDGRLIGCFETYTAAYNKSRFSKVPILKELYFGFQFIFKRVMPKLPVLKKLYFWVTKGKNRLVSKAEALGRLVSCGFEIENYQIIDGIHYFSARKVGEPVYDMNPSYGPIFKMRRVGKNGKDIGVYKFRTMHPYSEYLQDYVLKLNGYSNSGKPANDFRLVPWGKFLRRYWLDELPQLINVLKGEMKLVGVRPVSKRYFDDVPVEIQNLRLTQKPGCIPPYVALNRAGSVGSVLQAEKEYLQEKLKNPYFTDTKYFFKAIFNIIFEQKRSA